MRSISADNPFLKSLLMTLVALSGVTLTGLVGPNRAAIEAEFHLTHSLFGLGLALIQFAGAMGILLLAPRLKKLGDLKVIQLGLGVQACGFILIAFTSDVSGLAMGWLFITAGLVICSTGNNLSMELWRDNPRKGITLLHAFNAVGKVLGPLVAAFCIVWGWRFSFIATGMVILANLAAFLAYSFSRNQPEVHVPTPPPLSLRILRRGYFWIRILPFGLIAGGEAAFATLMPVYFHNQLGLSVSLSSLVLTTAMAGIVAGRFLAAYFSHNLSSRAVIVSSLACGLFFLPALFSGSKFWMWPCMFLGGFMFSATWPAYYAHISTHFPDQKPILAYGSSLGNFSGISLCILVSSFIADYDLRLGLLFGPVTLWVFGGLFILTSLSRTNLPASATPFPGGASTPGSAPISSSPTSIGV